MCEHVVLGCHGSWGQGANRHCTHAQLMGRALELQGSHRVEGRHEVPWVTVSGLHYPLTSASKVRRFMGSKLRKCYILDIRKKLFTVRMVKHEQRGGGCPIPGWVGL